MQKKQTYFLHCYVAGLQYYEVLEVWKKFEIGQVVHLVPEPQNRYDEHAVIVAFDDKKLGYLPRGKQRGITNSTCRTGFL